MSVRFASSVAAVLAMLAVAASPAFASLPDELAAGNAVAAQLQAGRANCTTLTDTRFEQLGEYVMDRMVGSRAAYSTMDQRMEAAIGRENTDRMHGLIGRRFAGCSSGEASGSGMMGRGAAMMDGWGAMSNSSAWNWMHNGAWRHMNSGDWRELAGSMMGTRYSTHHGWSTIAVLGAAFGALFLGALLAVFLFSRAWRRRPPTAVGVGRHDPLGDREPR